MARIRQFELESLDYELQNLAATAESNLAKITEDYGKLLLRKTKLESERRVLLLEYTSEHPNVKLKEVELNLTTHEIVLALR